MQFEDEKVAIRLTDDNPEAPASMPDFGERFEVLSIIGSGGMATVYKIRDKVVDKIFAGKVMKPELAAEPIAVKRFADEAEAASSMTHANIAAVYQNGLTASNLPWMCMDYLDGESLAELLKREGKLDARRALSLFQQICEALIHAHMKGVVHRDLTPGNIFIERTADGAELVKLVDFGLAKLQYQLADSTKLTQTGALIGSPFYMSPEQCRGVHQDARSDIYSFGCVMYEVLTGKPPFSSEAAVKVILQHVKDPPPKFLDSAENDGFLRALESCILRCLEKEPTSRFQSSDELLVQLQGLEANRPNIVVSVEAKPAPVARFVSSVIDSAFLVAITHLIGAALWGNPFLNSSIPFALAPWQLSVLGSYCVSMAAACPWMMPAYVMVAFFFPPIFYSMFFTAFAVSTMGPDSSILMPVMPVIFMFYCVLLESSPLRATLGQFCVGLQVVDKNGNRIGLFHASKRFLVQLCAPLVMLVEFGTRLLPNDYASEARNVLSLYWRLVTYSTTDAVSRAYIVRRDRRPVKVDEQLYRPAYSLDTLKLVRWNWYRRRFALLGVALVLPVPIYLLAPAMVPIAIPLMAVFILPAFIAQMRVKQAEAKIALTAAIKANKNLDERIYGP